MLYLVTGPPASGKSTWVRQRARHGDITIDYDALADVLTAPGGKPHDYPQQVRTVTKAARRAAIDAALQLADRHDVYVIHSMPGAELITRYRNSGAQIITIDPGKKTVLERCKRERPWQMHQAAKRWYDQPTVPVTVGNVERTAMEW